MKPLYIKKNGTTNKVSGIGMPSVYPAENVSFNNSTSGLEAENTQDAIDEVVNILNDKVDAVQGKDLSTNDYTDTEKEKLADISAEANKTEASTTNGNIKIDNVETPVYRLKGNNTVLSTDRTPYLLREALSVANASAYVREKLIGCSVAWNQLVQNGNFADTSNWTVSSGTFTVSNNVGSLVVGYVYQNVSMISGHTYLVSIRAKSTTANETVVRLYFGTASYYKDIFVSSANTWTTYQTMFVCMGTTVNRMDLYASVGTTNNYADIRIIDLTLAFGSSVADTLYAMTNNGGIDWLRNHNYPIDQYTQYGYGLYSTKPSAKKVVGKNLFDGTPSEVNKFLNSDGSEVATNGWYISQYIKVIGGQTYTIDYGGPGLSGSYICFYDGGKNFISSVVFTSAKTITFTLPENAHYLRSSYYATTTNFQLEKGSSHTDYEPYSCTTYSLGSTELRGHLIVQNGEIVAEGDVRESNGNVTRVRGRQNLGDLTWTYDSTNVRFIAGSLPNCNTSRTSLDWICAKYTVGAQAYSDSDRTNQVITIQGSAVMIRDSAYTDATAFKNAMAGVYLEYELATPTTETSSPFADPMSLNGCTTEEYVDTHSIPVPVGHETQYMGQSEDVVEIPSMPLADGDSVLHCQKSGNEAQIYWEGASGSTFGIGLAITLNTNYTIPSDGYVVLSCGYPASEYVLLKINGMNVQTIRNADNGGNNGPNYACVFVRKGMIANITGSTSATATFLPLC